MNSEEPRSPAPDGDFSVDEQLFLRAIGLRGEDSADRQREATSASSDEALRLLDGYHASEWLESTRLEVDPEQAEPAVSPASLLRTRLGPYRVRRLLGRNGSTAVYKAWQAAPVPRWVALKIHFDAAEGGETLERFRREQAVLARMDHPSIARLLDAGVQGDAAWFAMEHVDGDWITRWCRDRRLARRARVRLLRDAARAVEHAHAKGVIHRDLKPSNLLACLPHPSDPAESARAVIIDFGIARGTQGRLQRLAAITSGAPLLGTLASMAPEQITRGHAGTDVRTDVFALGSILHELAADRPIRSLDDRSLPDLVREIVEREPTPLRAIDPSIDRDLEAITAKSLRLRPSDRYQTAAAFADDLDRWLAGEEVDARHATWPDRAWRWLGRHRRATAIGLAASAIAVAAAAVGWFVAEGREQDRLRRLQSVERTLAEVDRLREVAGAKPSRAMLILGLDEESEALLGLGPDDPRTIGLRAEVLQHRALDLLSELLDSTPRPAVAAITEEMVGLRRRAIALGDATPEALERLSIAIVCDGDAQRPDLEAVRSRFLQSLAIDESLHAANPGVRRFHDNLAWSHHRLAMLASREGRRREAEIHFAAAREIARSLLAAHSDSPFSHLALGASSGFLGAEVAVQGRVDEAEVLLREGVEHLEIAAELAPLSPVFLIYRIAATLDLASLLVLTGRPMEAFAHLDRISDSAPILLKAEGSTDFLEMSMRRDAWLRARIAVAQGDAAEAARRLAALREPLDPGLDRSDDDASIAALEAEVLLLEGRPAEAMARLERSLGEAAAASGPAFDPVASGRGLADALAIACMLESAGMPVDAAGAEAISNRLATTLEALAAQPEDDLDADALERQLHLLAAGLARLRRDEPAAAAHVAAIESLPPPRDLETGVRLALLRAR